MPETEGLGRRGGGRLHFVGITDYDPLPVRSRYRPNRFDYRRAFFVLSLVAEKYPSGIVRPRAEIFGFQFTRNRHSSDGVKLSLMLCPLFARNLNGRLIPCPSVP